MGQACVKKGIDVKYMNPPTAHSQLLSDYIVNERGDQNLMQDSGL